MTSPRTEVEDNLMTDDNSSRENDLPNEVSMSIFDHFEEIRQRLWYSIGACAVSVILCFIWSKPIVAFLEVPAKNVKFIQISLGEYFWVTVQTAGYTGILLASPVFIYHIVAFLLPGLTRKEQRLVTPALIFSSLLFFSGLAFSYYIILPAALGFFISYGADIVEQAFSIQKYFDFTLLTLFWVGLCFQIPIIQVILGVLGIVSSQQMLKGWGTVMVGSVILGGVLTPSTDPITQCLLAGSILFLYFSGIGVVKLVGK